VELKEAICAGVSQTRQDSS